MSTIATLRIGKMEIDWSQNYLSPEHGKLFLSTDKKIGTYYYADETQEKELYSKKISDCKGRLELLGYTMDLCRDQYEYMMKEHYSHEFYDDLRALSFDEYAMALSSIDLSKIDPDFDDYGEFDYGEFVSKIAFQFEEFNKVVLLKEYGRSYGEFFTNLGAMHTLRLLMENEKNLDLEIAWCYQDVINSGYLNSENEIMEISDEDKFIIVTEGGSDTAVIKKAFEKLRPDIVDFFKFIDMKDNYPFIGTGNLLNFIKGLKSIGVQNKMVFIFDNDSEGVSNYESAIKMNLPKNMKVIKLPDLEDLKEFSTIGASGVTIENINGRASSIELFLDFKFVDIKPIVRWKNYLEVVKSYQGALEDKDKFLKSFKESNINDPAYDYSKLRILLHSIYDAAISVH